MYSRYRYLLLITVMAVTGVCTAAGIDYLETPSYHSDKATEGLLLDIVNSGKHLVVVGERGYIFYSSDLGKNWQQASVPVYVTLTGVFFITPDVGWAVGHEGVILHTSDAGKTWSKQLDGYHINKQILKLARQRVQLQLQKLESLTDESQREEVTYQLEEAGYALEEALEDDAAGPAKPLLDVWFISKNRGYAIGAYGIFLQTSNGGRDWELISNRLDNPEGFHLNSITGSESGEIFIAGEAGSIHKSNDNGINWTRLKTPYEGSYFGLISYGRSWFVFGLRGNVFRSDNNGDSWQAIAIKNPTTLSGGMISNTGKIILVGNAGYIQYSDNKGASFEYFMSPAQSSLTAAVQVSDEEFIAVGANGIHKITMPVSGVRKDVE